MSKNNFSDLSIEELNSRLKSSKAMAFFMLGILLFIFGMMLYGYFNLKGNVGYFIALFAGVIAPIMILPVLLINIKRINAEMNSRGN